MASPPATPPSITASFRGASPSAPSFSLSTVPCRTSVTIFPFSAELGCLRPPPTVLAVFIDPYILSPSAPDCSSSRNVTRVIDPQCPTYLYVVLLSFCICHPSISIKSIWTHARNRGNIVVTVTSRQLKLTNSVAVPLLLAAGPVAMIGNDVSSPS